MGGERLGGKATWTPSATPTHVLETLIRECQGNPLLVMVDEGSQESPQSFGALFNLCQKVNDETENLALVVAGTPATLDLIRASGATFHDRAERFNIGLLGAEASREAISKPLLDAGVSMDADVLAQAAENSQGYPYFL